ncbi:MAG: M18 family aminopeptidase [Methylococcaceae bacterium]|nr:MAG: M18 family aminopeptidase [Methylococcaceae bacterium]
MTPIAAPARGQAQALLDFIDASPSPWHAVAAITAALQAQGFQPLAECDSWTLQTGGRYYVARDDSTLAAFVVGMDELSQNGYLLAGAHTDSPGLRLKPQAAHAADPLLRLGVEVYGGPILATFADRDLSLAGRLCLADGSARRIRFEQPLLRLPNLAIHMNGKVNDEGLKFNKQTELPLLLGLLDSGLPPQQRFLQLLAERLACEPNDIRSWELHVYDTQPGAIWGADGEFIADSQLDNLASCHAILAALLGSCSRDAAATRIGLFFDHEEIGSASAKGAAGSFAAGVLERIALALNVGREGYLRALAHSFCVSADMAHAYHPNFPNAYEPNHQVKINQGPVIKINANQRYATDGVAEARFAGLCAEAGVPCQRYAHRSDLGCGSTIGPITASALGVRTVDVGNPMWAMHSVRESAGVLDHGYMIRVLEHFFG